MSKKGMHPNSLAALKKGAAPEFNSETAKIAAAKSAEVRRRNKEARDALKATASNFKKVAKELSDDVPSAIEILNLQMVKALANDDTDMVIELAKVLAEYQAPKLARTENTNVEVSADDLSDEELEAKLKAFLKDDDDKGDDDE